MSLHDAVQALVHIARVSREADVEPFLRAYERASGAKVTRTAEDLSYLQLDQPGPEVIHSGTVGAAGVARWAPPALEGGVLTFYANQPKADGADFVCVRLETRVPALSTEVVDQGWYETAADLSVR